MTRGRRWAAVAVALLAVLAGCNVFAPSPEAGPTETVTPVPVPTVSDSAAAPSDTATPRRGLSSFPGISIRSGVDIDAVLASHVSVLSAQSYTAEWVRRAGDGPPSIARRFQRRVEVGEGETHLRRAGGDHYGNVTATYVNGTRGYRRVVSDRDTTVTPFPVQRPDAASERFAQLVSFEVRTFFEEGYDDLAVVERGGRPYARVFTTRTPPLVEYIYDAYTVQNFTATMWVAPEGYVQAVHYEFDLVTGSQRVPVEWRYKYTGVGETTVDRPAWVPETATDASGVTTDRTATSTRTPDPARVPPSTASNVTASN